MHENIASGRAAEVDRSRRDAGEGAAAGAEGAGDRLDDRDAASCAGASRCPRTRSAAAARTTSATSRGTCRPCRSTSPPTSRPAPATTGRTRSRWRRRSRTRASIAGAKVQAMTMLDMVMRPEIVEQAWDYFKNVQTKNRDVHAPAPAAGPPAIWLNEQIMAKYRPEMKQVLLRPDEVQDLPRAARESSTRPFESASRTVSREQKGPPEGGHYATAGRPRSARSGSA